MRPLSRRGSDPESCGPADGHRQAARRVQTSWYVHHQKLLGRRLIALRASTVHLDSALGLEYRVKGRENNKTMSREAMAMNDTLVDYPQLQKDIIQRTHNVKKHEGSGTTRASSALQARGNR